MDALTLIYEATNCRMPKGCWRKELTPLKVINMMHVTRPYAAFSHCPWDL
jgi:hypothetical protein